MKEMFKSYGGTFLVIVASLVVLGLVQDYLPQQVKKFLPWN